MSNTSINNLPKDVVWLIVREVLKDWGLFDCPRPFYFHKGKMAELARPLRLINKRFDAIIRSKCRYDSSVTWRFINGAF